MDFRLVNPDAELLGATAPGHISQLYNAKGFETLTIAGFTEERPVCYAVFSRCCLGGDLYLEHIYTVPGENAEENRRSLIGYCTGRFGASGFDRMISKQYVPPHEAQNLHEGYKELGFVPLFLSGRLMVYRLEDTEMAQVRPVILRNLKKLPAVCTFKEAGEKRFRSFMKKIGRSDVSGMASYIPYSYFYMAGDEINAAMLAAKSGPDRIHISLTYLDGTALRDNVFLVLLTSVLSAAEKDMGTDYTFMINVDSDVIYRGLMQVFNPPDHEFFLMEHVLPFDTAGHEKPEEQGVGILTRGRLFPDADPLSALTLREFDLPKEELIRDGQERSSGHETDARAADPAGEVQGGLSDDPGDDAREIPDIMELLSVKENHLLSVNGFMGLDSLSAEDFSDMRRSSDRCFERARMAEERFYEVYSSFAEQEQKNRSAKKAKEYLLRFRDMREKLDTDDSISGEEKKSRLRGFIKDISRDIELFRELYVKKLGGGKRKERILEFLERYDELKDKI